MRHSLKQLSELPECEQTKKLLQSLAMLDAVLMPEWELRYFSFNDCWGKSGESMGSLRDGEGSEFFFLFSHNGGAAKIYEKGSGLGRKNKSEKEKVPKAFASFLDENAFNLDSATCYLWRGNSDSSWSVAPVTSKEVPLLAFLSDNGGYYRAWAEHYYEVVLEQDLIELVFKHEKLTRKLVHQLNSSANYASVMEDAKEIGYPYSK